MGDQTLVKVIKKHALSFMSQMGIQPVITMGSMLLQFDK